MTSDTWRPLGAPTGGTVAGLAVVGETVYAATPAGIRRSVDGGRTWGIAGERMPVPFANVVAAADQHVVYAGGREGAYRSVDRGDTWHQVLSGGNVLAVAAASGQVLLAGTEADGVLRSEDGGRTWSSANPGLLELTILALALSPAFERDGVAFAATASGLYRSRNGGRSWRAVDPGADEPAVQALAVLKEGLVLAGTEDHGLLVSRDMGTSWQAGTLAGHGVTALAVSAEGAIAAATESGVLLSHDGGLS
ncbi:MAG: hypothetical protein M3336_11950, partial [Chloroflexota bacterium]|nr:hypothetical protein [Chloroflexota bacterium]